MVAGVTCVGERVAHQVESDGDDRNDDRREDQHVRIIHKHVARIPQEVAQGRLGDIHQAQICKRCLIGDRIRDCQRQTQNDHGNQIGEDVAEQDAAQRRVLFRLWTNP